MNYNNIFALRLKRKKRNGNAKILFCVFFLILFVFNVFYFNDNLLHDNSNKSDNFSLDNKNLDITDISLSAGPEIFIDPFKINFTKKWNFFASKFKSDLDLDIETYYRRGNSLGVVTDDKIYSVDNLLLYKTLLKDATDAFDTFDLYLKLRDSPLWYQNSVDPNLITLRVKYLTTLVI